MKGICEGRQPQAVRAANVKKKKKKKKKNTVKNISGILWNSRKANISEVNKGNSS